MAVHMHDDIQRNILVRLPGKALLRFKCVSMHWNRLISDPSFMKSRSRQMILLPFSRPLAVIDDNVPVEDRTHSTVRMRSPLECHQEECTEAYIVGTLNGIVLLVLNDTLSRSRFFLYNPLTGASKIVLVIDRPPSTYFSYVFGFWYGATTDDLKIVRFEVCDTHFAYSVFDTYFAYDVFDLKTSLWIEPPQHLERDFYFCGNVGTFLNSYLYWVISLLQIKILALNVKEITFSKINLPLPCDYPGTLLGSLNGCLYMITRIDTIKFDLWVMKERGVQDAWSNVYSFTFGLEGNVFNEFHPMCILGNGKILLTNGSKQVVIYDTSKHSYKMLNDLASPDDFNEIFMHNDFRRIRSTEYTESFLSPSDI